MAETFILIYYFEKAARVQIAALSAAVGGAKMVMFPSRRLAESVPGSTTITATCWTGGSREWPAFLRLLDRIDPSYRE